MKKTILVAALALSSFTASAAPKWCSDTNFGQESRYHALAIQDCFYSGTMSKQDFTSDPAYARMFLSQGIAENAVSDLEGAKKQLKSSLGQVFFKVKSIGESVEMANGNLNLKVNLYSKASPVVAYIQLTAKELEARAVPMVEKGTEITETLAAEFSGQSLGIKLNCDFISKEAGAVVLKGCIATQLIAL